jgi:hypothetical protein
MPAAQNYKNHARFQPIWHFFIAPMLLVNFIFSIVATVRHWPDHPHLFLWWILLSFVMFVAIGVARGQALKVQDRIIRLEERLRLAALLPPDELSRSHALSVGQLIALRFASDAELPALVERALTENLTPKQIKQSIVAWRADYLRV